MRNQLEKIWATLSDEEKKNFPTPRGFPRGVGDVIQGVTKKLGIPTCGGCKKRRDFLNKKFPFRKIDDYQTLDDRKDIRQP